MSTITVQVPTEVKQAAQQKSRQDGVTLTFIIQQALKAYGRGDYEVGIRLKTPFETQMNNIIENDESYGPFDSMPQMLHHLKENADSV